MFMNRLKHNFKLLPASDGGHKARAMYRHLTLRAKGILEGLKRTAGENKAYPVPLGRS